MRSATSVSFRRTGAAAALAAAVVLCAGAAAAQSPRTSAAGAPPSETRIVEALQRGVKYLYNTQNSDGTWNTKHQRQHPGGMAGLAILAGLAAGESPDAAQMKRALEYVKGLRPETVYARAMRTMVYARLPGNEYALRAAEDAKWLIGRQERSGGWGYGPSHATTRVSKDWTDASNSQLALLALREAHDRGAPVPADVWIRALDYWTKAQNSDGGWGYEPPGRTGIRLRGSSYGSMTAGGVATLHIFQEVLSRRPGPGDGAARPAAVGEQQCKRGLAWLARNYAIDEIPGWSWGKREEWLYFYLFCLTRVTDAAGMQGPSGRKHAARLTSFVLSRQNRNGSWSGAPGAPGPAAGGDPVHTCLAMLSLVRASAPILISKLAIGDPADTMPDASAFARWFSRRGGWTGTWQLVGNKTSTAVLGEAPVLLIRGSGKFTASDSLARTLSAYVRGRGMVLVQAVNGNEEFAQSAEKYFLDLFPGYEARPCEPDHPLFNAVFKITPDNQPKVRAIGDRARARVLVAASPLAGRWGVQGVAERTYSLQIGANLLRYATGEPPAKTRFREKPVEVAPIETDRYIQIARIKHRGDWNAHPRAFVHLNNVVAEAVSVGVRQTPKPVDLSRPVPDDVTLLWLTGSEPPQFSAMHLQRLEQYLYGGGTLFVDSAVGDKVFAAAASEILAKAFGATALKPLSPDSPVLSGAFLGGLGGRIDRVEYTRAAGVGEGGGAAPRLDGVELNGRLAVIFSPYGVTGPLEGGPAYGHASMKPHDALRLAANVVLYAAVTKPELKAAASEKRTREKPPPRKRKGLKNKPGGP